LIEIHRAIVNLDQLIIVVYARTDPGMPLDC